MSKIIKKTRIGIIGFGLHAQRVYWKCLKKLAQQNKHRNNFEVPVLVDILDKKNCIESFIETERSKYSTSSTHWIDSILPQKYLYHQSVYNNNKQQLDTSVLDELSSLNLDAFLISTDPRSRKSYLEYAINNNINVLCDKPLMIPSTTNGTPCNMNMDPISSDIFRSEYFELCDMLQSSHNDTDIILMCQRRRHPGHLFVTEYLSKFIEEFQIPISFIHINHNDGLFLLPNEYQTMENHPFKYGYGKLFNSGYHFIDLLLWYQSINNNKLKNKYKIANEIELCCNRRYSVYDDHHAMSYDDLNNLSFIDKDIDGLDSNSNDNSNLDVNELYSFGDLDSYNLFQFKHKDSERKYSNNVITTASIQLLHKSFSRRSWMKLPYDVNKENGRIRHELLTIVVGSLLTIHIRSFQSFEDQKLYQNKEQSIPNNEIGGANHFEVDIFRNSQLCGGQTYEHISFGSDSMHDYDKFESLMFESRYNTLRDFLDDHKAVSDMSILSKNSMDTVRLISSIYKNIAMYNSNNNDNDSVVLRY